MRYFDYLQILRATTKRRAVKNALSISIERNVVTCPREVRTGSEMLRWIIIPSVRIELVIAILSEVRSYKLSLADDSPMKVKLREIIYPLLHSGIYKGHLT